MTRPIFARGLGTSPAGPAGRDGINSPPDGAFLLYATSDSTVADAHPEYAWVILSDDDSTAPTTPTGLAATPGDGQVALSWTASTDAVGVTAYKVRRGGTVVASPTTTNYTDTGRTNGTSYSYTVSAVDLAGNESAQTSAVTATPAVAISPRTDTFNRSNTTSTGLTTPSDGGSAWIKVLGTTSESTARLHITSNKAESSVFTSNSELRWEADVLDCLSANGTVTMTLGGTPTEGGTMGLMLRYTDVDNYVFAVPSLGYDAFDLRKRVAGTTTYVGGLIASGAGLTPTSVVSCVMTGASYQFKINGVDAGAPQVLADVPASATKHGLIATAVGQNADSWGFSA